MQIDSGWRLPPLLPERRSACCQLMRVDGCAPLGPVCRWLITLVSLLCLSAAGNGNPPASLAAHQAHYDRLESQLITLEQRNTTSGKCLTVSLAIILDLALELVHSRVLQHYSPDYFYDRPLNDMAGLNHLTRDLITYTLSYGHIPALLAGVTTWIGENLFELPELPTGTSLAQLGVIGGLLAGGYGLAFSSLMLKKPKWTIPNQHGDELLNRLEPSAVPWFMAAAQLQSYKHWLQAAAAAAMVTSSYLIRKSRQANISDLRTALTLARDRLRRDALRYKQPNGSDGIIGKPEASEDQAEMLDPFLMPEAADWIWWPDEGQFAPPDNGFDGASWMDDLYPADGLNGVNGTNETEEAAD